MRAPLFAILVLVCLLTVAALMMGCRAPMVDMRRIYIVEMYGAGDNTVPVSVGGVEHANTIEAKVADKVGASLLDVSGNQLSAGVSKGAVKASVK